MWWGLVSACGQWLRDESGRLIHYPDESIALAHAMSLPEGWAVRAYQIS